VLSLCVLTALRHPVQAREMGASRETCVWNPALSFSFYFSSHPWETHCEFWKGFSNSTLKGRKRWNTLLCTHHFIGRVHSAFSSQGFNILFWQHQSFLTMVFSFYQINTRCNLTVHIRLSVLNSISLPNFQQAVIGMGAQGHVLTGRHNSFGICLGFVCVFCLCLSKINQSWHRLAPGQENKRIRLEPG